MRSRFALLVLALSVVIGVGCDSGSPPDAGQKAQTDTATAATTKVTPKKGGGPPRRPVAESKKFDLAPRDD